MHCAATENLIVCDVNDSLSLVQPFLHSQNHITNFLKARCDVLFVLNFAGSDEGRQDFIEFFPVLVFETENDKSMHGKGSCDDLEEILEEIQREIQAEASY